jgi:hypothetical protein
MMTPSRQKRCYQLREGILHRLCEKDKRMSLHMTGKVRIGTAVVKTQPNQPRHPTNEQQSSSCGPNTGFIGREGKETE